MGWYWASNGPVLGQYWAGIGPVLGQHSHCIGPVFGQYWANTLRVLVQYRSSIGLVFTGQIVFKQHCKVIETCGAVSVDFYYLSTNRCSSGSDSQSRAGAGRGGQLSH